MVSSKRLSAYLRNKGNIFKEIALAAFSIFMTVRVKDQVGKNLFNVIANLAIPFLFKDLMTVKNLVEDISTDKLENYKEYMMINGLRKGVYYAQHLVMAYKSALFTALTMGFALSYVYGDVLTTNSGGFIIVSFLISGITVCHFALVMASIFNPRSATDISIFVTIIAGVTFFLAMLFDSEVGYYIACTNPVSGLSMGIIPLFHEDKKLNSPNLFKTNIYVVWGIMILSNFVYLPLFSYLERDREKSTAKKAQKKTTSSLEEPLDAGYVQSQHFISAIHQESFSFNAEATVQISELEKKYGNNHVIRGLSVSIFEGEIFCLLGHNGAGKTTVVNMMTGLAIPTSGNIYYNGIEFFSNFEKLKGTVGFCPQKDIIENLNTVTENLRLIAEIKQIPKEQIDNEIERVIKKCDLSKYVDRKAGDLSGGNKRKLCMARAILGSPKIVILDEPTSGMDAVSRQVIWRIIRELKKEGTTLILTTQFLDEAESLSDRVAILNNGNIFAIGSVKYLNKNFGVGYHLMLTSKQERFTNDQKMPFIKLVKESIPSAVQSDQSSEDAIEFILPFNTRPKFAELFSKIEALNTASIGLQVGNLEETFINIGLNPEKFARDADEKLNEGVNLNVESVPIPDCYYKDRKYSFGNQFKAMMLKRLLLFKKEPSLIVFMLLPSLFIAFGFYFLLNDETRADRTNIYSIIQVLPLLAMPLISISFVGGLVYEREHQIVETMKVMGLRPGPYWLSNILIDVFFGFVVSALMFMSVPMKGLESFKELGEFRLFMLLYSFTFATIGEGYLFGMFQKSTKIAKKAYPGFVLGGYVVVGILSTIDIALWIKNILYIIFCFFGPSPLFFFSSTFYFTDRARYFESFALPLLPPQINPWICIAITFAFGAVSILLSIVLENRRYNLKPDNIKPSTEQIDDGLQIDPDVKKEINQVKSNALDYTIKVDGMSKVYPGGFQALQNATFGVEKSQIFAFLGPNGAGKSTTFNILTAVIPRTAGSVQLLGTEMKQGVYDVFDHVGVCPQTNPIWNELSTVEHMRIYAKMKGISPKDTQEIIDYFLDALLLRQFANTNAGGLSGGNKRKLCVAMCLMGAPQIQFLDEPTTGVDPVARKFIWNCLKNGMKGRNGSMILTTHYLQEAESIANKLGILINGKVACIGNIPELKRKFGEYTIEVSKSAGQNVDKTVNNIFRTAKKYSETKDTSVYKVSHDQMVFSYAFQGLEEAKEKGVIIDFSIFTSNLESIFLKFAKKQRGLSML